LRNYGSGKLTLAYGNDTGVNLAGAGKNSETNLMFRTIFCNTIKAFDYSDVLRSIDRFSANVAPLAPISSPSDHVFSWESLTRIFK